MATLLTDSPHSPQIQMVQEFQWSNVTLVAG